MRWTGRPWAGLSKAVQGCARLVSYREFATLLFARTTMIRAGKSRHLWSRPRLSRHVSRGHTKKWPLVDIHKIAPLGFEASK
jgi:hypothetical protein